MTYVTRNAYEWTGTGYRMTDGTRPDDDEIVPDKQPPDPEDGGGPDVKNDEVTDTPAPADTPEPEA